MNGKDTTTMYAVTDGFGMVVGIYPHEAAAKHWQKEYYDGCPEDAPYEIAPVKVTKIPNDNERQMVFYDD